jgi:hypothetical protein
MLDKRTTSAAMLTLALLLSCPTTAATVWDEAVNGNLSNNPLAPTSLTFAPGPNDVIGQAGDAPLPGALAPFGQDFFTFTVPTGYTFRSLTAVSVDLFTSGDLFAFIAIQSGPQITHDVSPPTFGGDASGLLGWLHVAASDQGTDILPAMGVAGDGATGFTGALGVGQYSVWVEDDKPLMMLVGLAGVGFVGHRTRAVFGV